ncbi:hypothetical protein H1L16_001403 [Salmonella enterica]|nr:hypothetical protein [Salmonella enterica]QQI31839.1 hypothetical protein HFS24_04140 [Salmonella enterica subsp. houtenae serovar 43:z4]EBB9333859.1 hypothetical protein [Salmonella enterica]EBC0978825.1 hypothetical protein [Salmonella enterica]EBP3181952.1 hypothetical protein [Salmonella enterica]
MALRLKILLCMGWRGSMPVPMMNIINDGEHADNNIDIQEIMIQPDRFSDRSSGCDQNDERRWLHCCHLSPFWRN